MSTPSGSQDPSSSGRGRWPAYWVCVSVAALTVLDTTKIYVALPSIEHSLHATSTELQLVVSGYILAFGLTLVPAGRLGDLGSRKRFFVIGLCLFILTSVACALAPTGLVLSIARFVQGIAAGMQTPQVIGFIQSRFHGAERGLAFGVFGSMLSVGTALGPTLGGALIELGGEVDGWRGIFWINVPLGVIALVAALWVLPSEKRTAHRRANLDLVGTAIFGLTVTALMAPFLFTTGSPDDDPMRWWLLVPFVLGAAGFVAWEQHYQATGRTPLLPLRLFRVGSFRNGTILATLFYAALLSGILVTTLYLQEGLGLSALFAGMVGIGYAIASALGSWWGGSIVNRYGRPLVLIGTAIAIAGFGILIAVGIFTPPVVAPWAMFGVMTLAGFGVGLVVSPNQSLLLEDIPTDRGGIAGSVSQLGQRVGSAVGAAVGLAFFYSTMTRASDTTSGMTVYHDAYAIGMLPALIFLALAFMIGVADLGARRRKGRGKHV